MSAPAPEPRRVADLLAEGRVGEAVAAQGWLRTARHAKNVSFLDLTDGSCLAGLQVVAPPELPEFEETVRGLRTGCAVRVAGELVESPGKGQRVELRASRVELVGDVGDDYPLQKKRHSFEFLREIAHLRPRTNTLGAVLRVRSETSAAVHAFFRSRGFVHLHTPVITLADAEGAGEMFRVSALPADDPPRTPEGRVDFSRDFFGDEAHLTVSGQLEAEAAALALGRVYTFGPTFRAENSNTSRHLAEFWMVEPEMAFCDLDGDAELAEAFLKEVLEALLARCPEDMRFFDDRIQKGVIANLEHIVETPFERLRYDDAVTALEKSGRAFELPVVRGGDLQTEHERWLTEEHVKRPVVVTDWPAAIKAFYMYANDDGRTVRAMDVLVPRVGEIVGGSQREHRHDVLVDRMRAKGLDPADYGWYLDLRRHGSAPHAGFGLGFERLVQVATGMANI
ncbi:MAG: asparagine--tRNA ligase, partial [Myxococcota bacterium]|nr:asparagine--tRNA ligase [Myxococcota bacterium]